FGLVPGTYDLVVDENVSSNRAMRYQNQSTDQIVLAVGQGTLAHDIDIVVRTLVIGNATLNGTSRAATLRFDGPDDRTVDSTTTGGLSRFYRYSFAGTATVTPGQVSLSLDLAVTRTLDNTTVSGTASLAGTGVDASITFTARGGGAISVQASADSSGSYSASLAPGTYDVFASRLFGSAVYLARVIVPHAGSFARDLTLTQGFLLSGTVRNPSGAPASTPVTIESGAELDVTSDGSGAFQVSLPAGVYTI